MLCPGPSTVYCVLQMTKELLALTDGFGQSLDFITILSWVQIGWFLLLQ